MTEPQPTRDIHNLFGVFTSAHLIDQMPPEQWALEFQGKYITGPESFSTLLIPQAHIGRGVSTYTALMFFQPFLDKVADAAKSTYQGTFGVQTVSRNIEGDNLEVLMEGPDLRISYSVQPLLEAKGPNIYLGILNLVQTPVDHDTLGDFLRKLMPDFYFAYSTEGPRHFQTFESKGEVIIAEDHRLLDELGVKPEAAAEYFFFPGVVCWRKVDLTKSP
jgi:hypothetical protein